MNVKACFHLHRRKRTGVRKIKERAWYEKGVVKGIKRNVK